MKHGAGGPKHSEEVSANQLLLRALAGQSPGAITPASSESLRTQRRHQPRNWPILSWLTAAVMEAGERRRRRKRRRKRERENREQHLRKSEKLLQDLDTAEMFYPGGRGAMAKGAAVDRSRDVSRPALNPACGPAISERQALSAGREQRRIPTNFGRRDPGGVCSASPTSCPGQQIERDLYKSILITKQNKTKQNKTKNTLVSSHLKYRYITQTASKIFL
ncbi:uncharacterized protein LOC134148452 isoform X1 [Rhea pennata]|uniref:uncharacterized protein LOC134148452 isoform X1 n=1 Tax=Rhea pennata TaxID=8795 RepID=UPI002E27309B